jgi:hypothetical protein
LKIATLGIALPRRVYAFRLWNFRFYFYETK